MSELVTTAPGSAMALPDIAAMQAEANVQTEGVFGIRLSFLPYIQLFTGNSKPVQTGKIGVAHFGIVKNKELTDLGKQVLCIPLAYRAKAMDVNGDRPKGYFNPQTDAWKNCKARADADSNSGFFYGPEFLLWTAEHGFCTFMFGSKSARNAAPGMKALLPSQNGVRTAILDSTFIETDTYSWHCPDPKLSSQPLSGLPIAEVAGYVNDFLHPSDSVEEEPVPTEAVKTDR